jgi:hypothetical protein
MARAANAWPAPSAERPHDSARSMSRRNSLRWGGLMAHGLTERVYCDGSGRLSLNDSPIRGDHNGVLSNRPAGMSRRQLMETK